jgi:hypothetical protein
MIRFLLALACFCFVVGCKKSNPTPEAANPPTAVDTIENGDIKVVLTDNPYVKPADSPVVPDSFITYLIKNGNNYCENNQYAITTYSYLHFRAMIDSSGIYTTVVPANQQDINKLYGFADCSSHHQTNSARFGWNWYNGQMHIHAYCYSGGVRAYKELGLVNINEVFDCELRVLPGKYIFTLNGVSDTLNRGCTDNAALGYKLLPYFGGDEAAPHDVRIRIREM